MCGWVGGGGCVACRIIVPAPVPVPFLWDLDLGPGFWTWTLDLDLVLAVSYLSAFISNILDMYPSSSQQASHRIRSFT